MREKENYMLPMEYSRMMEHDKWLNEIPYIQFDDDWIVQVSPPFAGAVVRFRVKKGDAEVSVYLDCYDRLGIYGQPYWEVYPHNEDVYRCAMNGTDDLLNAIRQSIKEQ